MLPLGYKVFSVVAGGVLVGSLGASFVDPVPKEPEPQWWQLTGRGEVEFDRNPPRFAEAGPEDLYVPRQDSFAPAWASGDELWRYPVPEIEEWQYEPYPTVAELNSQLDAQLADDAALVDAAAPDPVTAAEEASAAAADAQLAQASAPPAAPGEVRKSELAEAGLY